MAKEEKVPSFTVAVKGPGVDITLPVPPTVAHRVVSIIMGVAAHEGQGDQPPGNDNSAGGGEAHVRSARGKTAREALNTSQAKRTFDKITAIGAMVMDNGANSFTLDDLRTHFRRASEVPPQNLTRDVQSAVRLGWIAPDGDVAGAYYVTQDGRTAIENKFSGEAKKKVKRAKPKTKKVKRGAE